MSFVVNEFLCLSKFMLFYYLWAQSRGPKKRPNETQLHAIHGVIAITTSSLHYDWAKQVTTSKQNCFLNGLPLALCKCESIGLHRKATTLLCEWVSCFRLPPIAKTLHSEAIGSPTAKAREPSKKWRNPESSRSKGKRENERGNERDGGKWLKTRFNDGIRNHLA